MSLLRMAWRYVWNRPAVSALAISGIALGAALIAFVLTLERETGQAFRREATLFDLVAGAKGSPLQLTLSAVYHLDAPTGNIPFRRYEALREDPRVRFAAPIGLGDNFGGFRIVGTVPGFFELERHRSGESAPVFSLREGRMFESGFEAVIGSQAAIQTGLTVGSRFAGVHGLSAVSGSETHGEFPYTVTGILNPSGTSNDRAIFVPLESVWRIHEKEAAAHGRSPQGGLEGESGAAEPRGDEREVTAVLVQLRAPGMRWFMAEEIRKNTESMAAIPANEMLRLQERILGPARMAMLAAAMFVCLTAALAIAATLAQAAELRKREIALARMLGARRIELFGLVLFEGVILVASGLLAGWILGHGAVWAASPWIERSAGLSINPFGVSAWEFYLLGACGVMGLAAGAVPAMLVYRRTPLRELRMG